ncbi:cyclic AMP-dependent transcription factor ATF-6 alpha [Anopheles nili]|uniref:cyclic AMP-dependent transcription factor ATF-6 alpha n=1 Tax=Anopheles nili TaxID=185578 RepID=UPI00237A29A3|nr:cyclic AMP-dependent transcription factor ATF-6 alpha [Anopheles nili]
MDSSFSGHENFDLSLENEYLSPAMFESVPLAAGFSDFESDNLILQSNPPTWNTINEFSMDTLESENCNELFNPDDFLNDVPSNSSAVLNRDTPSPSDSQKSYDSLPSSGGFDGCHVVPMHLDSPPISPQTSSSPLDGTNAINHIGGSDNIHPVKVVPKSTSSNVTKTITKKTIVLSAKDYKALLEKMQRKPSSNTILLKATPTNNPPIGVAAKEGMEFISQALKQEKATVLPKPLATGSALTKTRNDVKPQAVAKEDGLNSVSSLTVPMILGIGSSISEHTIDEKMLKKHQRMIKNRQSAYQSRQKKKDYVTSLEERLQELSKENNQLKMENASLLERLSIRCTCAANSLLLGHSTVKQVSPNARKNAAIVFAMLFMVSLNFFPIGNLLTNQDQAALDRIPINDKIQYHSRGLLWTNDSSERGSQKSLRINITALDELTKDESFPSAECPFYVNQTENIRLASELRRWIGENGFKNLTDTTGQTADVSIDTFDKMFRLKDTIDSMYRQMKDISVQMKTYERRQKLALNGKKSASKRQHAAANQREMATYRRKVPRQHDLDLYYPSVHVKYAEFFEEIGRRDDTFYLVSFSEEHLLLPALAYNKTNRPRMSLMLPTITSSGVPMANGTDRSEKITLMQIDCEVMNTSVIQIREKTIPGDLRPQGGDPSKAGPGSTKASYEGRNTTASGAQQNRATGRASAGNRLVRSNSTTTGHPANTSDGLVRKRDNPHHHHQHVPNRPFFVERMNEHLKSELHVN